MLRLRVLRPGHLCAALVLGAGALCGPARLGAQAGDSLTHWLDSVKMARERGTALGAKRNTAGWAVAGFILPPAIVVSGVTASNSWDKNRAAAAGAALSTYASLATVRRRARTVPDPARSVVAAVIGNASPVVRNAFVDAYKERVHRKRVHRLTVGAALSAPVILGAAFYVWAMLGGAEGH